jgi:tripartite-type tricarboxylate transporter receptor subunit TctC
MSAPPSRPPDKGGGERLLRAGGFAALLFALLVTTSAHAQPYPSKAVRFVVPFAPAGPTDIVARLLSQRLSESWGQPVVVENRPGAGGNLGTSLVARAAADGYTVLVHTSAIAVNATLSPNAGYDIDKDFVPILNLASSPNMMITAVSGPASLRGLIESSRANGVIYGSPGTGTTPHLTAEYLFKVLAGLKTTHVPYKGGAPAAGAAISGEVPVVSMAMPTAVPHIKAGKLRGLVIMSAQRVPALPDVPTIAEAGFPAFEDYTWVAAFTPSGTPRGVVAKISADMNAILAERETRERLAGIGFDPVGGAPEAFAAYLKGEVAKWAKVIRETGAKAE